MRLRSLPVSTISQWCNAVEQRRGHLGIAEDGRPLAEREVRGDDDAGALIKLADEVEQQLPSRACERQISKLVEHDQAEPRQLRRQGPALADPGLLFEACHQLTHANPVKAIIDRLFFMDAASPVLPSQPFLRGAPVIRNKPPIYFVYCVYCVCFDCTLYGHSWKEKHHGCTTRKSRRGARTQRR